MAARGMRVPCFLAGMLWMLWMAPLTSCFNLEPRTADVYSDPYFATQGRESYFGFSVALLHNSKNNTNWVLVGAPRANSSFCNSAQITEPGAMFKCNLEGDVCEEVIVDRSGNAKCSSHDLSSYGWLGGSLDSQPHLEEDRQVTGVCAPRWSNQWIYRQQIMKGVCFWMDFSASPLMIKKEFPFFPQTSHGQAGMSIHFPENQTKFIVGAPGVKWHGSVILLEDGGVSEMGLSKNRMFQTVLVPDPVYISTVKPHDMFGYAVTSGRFLSKDKILYAGGAPGGADFYGKVIVFDFAWRGYSDLDTAKVLTGEQLGEYFGAALTAADVNGDGLTDLIVGSPMFSRTNHSDVGRIHTFLSGEGKGLFERPEPHYGKKERLARFGTSLASPGDLNADNYEDVLVGAPWEGRGAVYVFLGSRNGLRQQYSQRLSPEDFSPPGLRGFGMSMSRGIDIDNNGYPDVAIGSILSGHVAVVKTRPVAKLSGWIVARPSSVPWEGRANLTLTTCLHYEGRSVPRNYSLQVSLTLDHGSPSPRASFRDNSYVHTFTEDLLANSADPACRTHQVTVKENKLDPDQPLDMKLEYDLLHTPATDLMKQPTTSPSETHTSMTQVSISKGCQKICRVDMKVEADLGLGEDKKLVVGHRDKLVLRTVVSNNGDSAYFPAVNVTVGPPLTLVLPQSHDCRFFSADLRTSLVCSLSNPIKNSTTDVVEVTVDASLLTDGSSNPWIQVNVSGEGEELKPEDNHWSKSLPLEAHASLELYGASKREQVFYKHVGGDNINATVNPRFTHTFTLVKKGPTPLGQVDLTVDVPVNVTDGQNLLKLHFPKTDFLHQPFHCKLSSGSFERDDVSQGGGVATGGNTGSDAKPSLQPIIVSAQKDEGDGTQYFDCSSSLTRCAQLSCHIYNWPVDTETAKLTMELEVDLSVMAKHMSAKGGAVLVTSGRASIQPLAPRMDFIGVREAREEAGTRIQPEFLQANGIPWWAPLLAVIAALLLLGLLTYGLYKAGFFKRKKMEEMKAQQAETDRANCASDNQGFLGD
ncbi:integrin alpha-PS3-like [Eriocheir sinensis]|uniref:integrin alpha-PS3-like n=1 Tax=Eriocheir sinensis TaxID=95602 RepID=UPI0021C78944|nr:integrin alpha-PS3-like [Eriocheir sinensis]